MLTATRIGNNIILQSTNVGTYVLERRIGTGSWEPWNGSGWGGSALPVNSQNFTDYDLSDGVYQYRYTIDPAPVYLYSNCVPVGSDPVGWTFRNYVVPEGQFGEILTPDDMRYTMMWGTPFTSSDGQSWDDEQSRYMVESAVYQLEKALNIDIFPRSYYADTEANDDIEESKFVIKDYTYPSKRGRRYAVTLRHRPVREVTRFDYFSPTDDKILDLSPWLRIDRRKGVLDFYPRQGKLQSFTSNSLPWANILGYLNYKGAYHIDYTTGYKTAELIPEDLREILGMIAALKMLNIIGDGLLAGFSSSSISLDGLSESFSSTQSATSVGGNMLVRLSDKDVKIKEMYENKMKYLDRPVLSINRKTNVLEEKRCIDIVRHNVSKKKCYRIYAKSLSGDIFHIDVTEDHSLFDPNMKTIKGSDVKVGSWLRMMLINEPKMKVVKIRRLRFIKYMYDLSVEDNENFTANGFAAHNSSYYGARIKNYVDTVAKYIAENKNKYGNFRIGSI